MNVVISSLEPCHFFVLSNGHNYGWYNVKSLRLSTELQHVCSYTLELLNCLLVVTKICHKFGGTCFFAFPCASATVSQDFPEALINIIDAWKKPTG